MVKKMLFLLLSAILWSSCSDDTEDTTQTVESAPVSVLAYMVAENNLDSYLKQNIRTMFSGLSSLDKSATLLIYWDGKTGVSGIDTPVILRYTYDGKGKINGMAIKNIGNELVEILSIAEIVKEYPDQVSTDKDVMSQVLKDMASLSPTNRIGLVAGSHANSWIEASSRSRAFGDDSGNSINISDMAEAMGSTNRTFDFLLFDACLMGSAEVCYDFRNVTNYQIVSVLEIPADGFPYDMMLANLYEGTVEGYKKACQAYINYYGHRVDDGISNSWGTISLIDSHKMVALSQAVEEQILQHKDRLGNFDVSVLQEYGKRFEFKYISVDAKQFVKVLNDGNVPSGFESAMNDVVVYTDCLDKASTNAYNYVVDKDNYCGLGIYVPVRGEYEWNNYFKKIDWYTAAGWDNVTFDWYF